MALSVYTPTGIVHETSVDFTKRVLTEPVHLVQYDESLPVVAVTCLDAGQYMTLTALDTVSIRMDKGDGTFIYNPALGMSADGHIVYIQITLQMTANYGRFEPVLELLRNGGYGASSPIPLFIDANPVPNSAIQSTDEFQTVESMYNTVIGFSDALNYLNTPVAQTDVANAEENATSAAASASAAATSESNAADSEASAAASAAEAHAVVDSSTITFTQSQTRENIVSGETISVLFGKIENWLGFLATELSVKTGTIEWQSAISGNVIASFLKSYGKVCVFFVRSSAVLSTETFIATTPSGFRPSNDVYVPLTLADTGTYGRINPSGQVFVSPKSASQWMLQIVYIAG